MELLYISFIADRNAHRVSIEAYRRYVIYTHTRLTIVRQLALETLSTHRGHALTRLSLDAIMRIARGVFRPDTMRTGVSTICLGPPKRGNGWMDAWNNCGEGRISRGRDVSRGFV